MKKILFILSFLIITNIAEARDCKSGDIKGDAFIYSDGKKVKAILGTDIPNPENKIKNGNNNSNNYAFKRGPAI